MLKGKTAYADGQLITGTIELFSPGKSIVPGRSAQEIAAGVYLAQDLIIAGDKNLLPVNIRAGVTIFGVTGTYVPEEE